MADITFNLTYQSAGSDTIETFKITSDGLFTGLGNCTEMLSRWIHETGGIATVTWKDRSGVERSFKMERNNRG